MNEIKITPTVLTEGSTCDFSNFTEYGVAPMGFCENGQLITDSGTWHYGSYCEYEDWFGFEAHDESEGYSSFEEALEAGEDFFRDMETTNEICRAHFSK